MEPKHAELKKPEEPKGVGPCDQNGAEWEGSQTPHICPVPHAQKDKEQAGRFNMLVLSKGICRGGKTRHSDF